MNKFEGYVLVMTARAILFQGHFWGAALWLPLSQIEVEDDLDSTEYVVTVKDWLCKKKRLLEFTPYSEEEIRAMDG